jgi:DNA-binding PadR family transcriptional regulator
MSKTGLMKRSRKYLGYDLNVLERFRQPTTVYDIIKLGYSHSSAYNLLQKYLKYGIIKPVKTEKITYGIGYKKYYTLTSFGQDLLSLLQKAYNNSKI